MNNHPTIKNVRAFLKASAALRGTRYLLDTLTDAEKEVVVSYLIGGAKKNDPSHRFVGGRYCLESGGLARFTDMTPEDRMQSMWPTEIFAVSERKIDSIKFARAVSGAGLKEAKDFVEGTFTLYLDGDQAYRMGRVFEKLKLVD